MNAFKTSKAALLTALLIGASISLAACNKKEDTPMEKASDSVGDALNMRDHEKLKDAGEDAKDAAKNTMEGVKEEANKATDGK